MGGRNRPAARNHIAVVPQSRTRSCQADTLVIHVIPEICVPFVTKVHLCCSCESCEPAAGGRVAPDGGDPQKDVDGAPPCPSRSSAYPSGSAACPSGSAACPSGSAACPSGSAACPSGSAACPSGS